MPRSRNNRIDFMLNDDEFYKFKDKVSKTKLNQSEFIRSAIFGVVLKEKPDNEFHDLMKSISKIGSNINQIAYKLNSNEEVERAYILEQGKDLKQLIYEIRKRYY